MFPLNVPVPSRVALAWPRRAAASVAVCAVAFVLASCADAASPGNDAKSAPAPAAAAPAAAAPDPADAPATGNNGQRGAAAPENASEAGPALSLAPCPANVGSLALPPLNPMLAANVRERVRKRIGGAVMSVCRTPFVGLYEVVVDADIIYVDEHVNYLIAGNAFDLHTQENITAARKEEATRIDFKSLPFQMAVKTVRGNGSRVLAVFEDPNCPYCKRFEHDMAGLNDTTIYTFLYPILSRDPSVADDSYPKSKSIWCASDRTLAWSAVMLQGQHLPAAPDSCKPPLDDILALGQKLHIMGTPTIIFTDGRRAPGLVSMDKIEQMLARAERPETNLRNPGVPGVPNNAPAAASVLQ